MKIIKGIFKVLMILIVLSVMAIITIAIFEDLGGNYFDIIHAIGFIAVGIFAIILFKLVKD